MNDLVLEMLLWPLQTVCNIILVFIFTLLSLDEPASWWNRFLVLVHWMLLSLQPIALTIWGERGGFLAPEDGTRWLEEIALWLLRSRVLVIPSLAITRVFMVAWAFRWVLQRRGHHIVVSGVASACMLNIASEWEGHFGSWGLFFTWREFWQKARIMADQFDHGKDDEQYYGVYFAVDKYGVV